MAEFISRNKLQRVVLEPIRPIWGRDGQEGTTQGKTVEFTRGVFRSTPEKAKTLGFKGEAELNEALRKAGTFNREFWELGNAPDAQKPSVSEMLAKITDATAYQRVDALRELRQLETEGDGEQGGHQREEVLASIDRALGILTEGREGKRGAGKPQPVPKPLSEATQSQAEVRKAMTRPEA